MRPRGGGAPTPDRLDAIGALWIKWSEELLWFAGGLGLQPEDAEDVVATVFARLLASAMDPARVEPGFLFRSIQHGARDLRRGRRRFTDAMQIWASERPHRRPGPADPERILNSKLLTQGLRQALGGLSARERDVLAWRYLDGMSCQEIADRLGISRAYARQKLRRARKMLRALLEADGVG